MTILIHPSFKKSFEQRIARNPKLVKRMRERLSLFQRQSNHPLLRNHALIGAKLNLRAFSVTGDIRIVYQPLDRDRVILLDIGTHNQVY